MLFVIILIFIVNIAPAQAAIVPDYYVKQPDQVPFFKSAKSLFPSGFTTLEKLRKHLLKSESATDNYYRWNKIYFSQDELRPAFATHLSKYVIDNYSNERYKVMDTNTKTLYVYSEKFNSYQKVNHSEVHADAYDMGFAMALKDVYLRTAASDKSAVKTTIPLGTPIVVESYDGNFAKVKYQSYSGWISLSEIMTKFDFASFVFAEKEWHPVKKREFDTIVTADSKRIPLNNITGIIAPPDVGLIASSTQKIPLWSKVIVTQKKLPSWQQSQIPEHGIVWWKPNREYEQVYYTIDELLEREVSYVSFHPQNPYKGIVSADGIFVSQNGFHWKKLQQFEAYNGPVLYLNDSVVFVGNWRSTDGGKSFENFIQIDKLASAIELHYGFSPKKLQVKKIEAPTPAKIKLEIETGIKKIKLESPIFSQDWRASHG